MSNLPAPKMVTVLLFLALSFSFLAAYLVPVFAASSSNMVATDGDQVVGVSSLGSPSLSSPNGQNLFEDSFGEFIAIYVDYAGRLSVTYANSNPLSTAPPTSDSLPSARKMSEDLNCNRLEALVSYELSDELRKTLG